MPSTWRINTKAVFTYASTEKCLFTIAAAAGRPLIIPRFSIYHAAATAGYTYTRWARINAAGVTTGGATIAAVEDGPASGETQSFTIAAAPAGSAGVDATWSTSIPTLDATPVLYWNDTFASNGGYIDWNGTAMPKGGLWIPAGTSVGLFMNSTVAAYAPTLDILVYQ